MDDQIRARLVEVAAEAIAPFFYDGDAGADEIAQAVIDALRIEQVGWEAQRNGALLHFDPKYPKPAIYDDVPLFRLGGI